MIQERPESRRYGRAMSGFTARRARPLVFTLATAMALTTLGCAPSDDDAKKATTTTTVAGAATTSVEGRFRVEWPAEPVREVQSTDAAGVTLEVITYSATVDDEHLYQVAYVDYPDSLGPLDPAGTLDGAANGAVNRTGGTMGAKTTLRYLDQPAIRFSFTAQGATIEAQSLLVGRRLYTLQAVSRKPPAPAFEHMLATFGLAEG